MNGDHKIGSGTCAPGLPNEIQPGISLTQEPMFGSHES
jgi:hypothetical protein